MIEIPKLIEHYGLDCETARLCITLPDGFARVHEIDPAFAAPDILIRRRLPGNLTAWLFNFYDSHCGQQQHSAKLLWQLSGSQGEPRKFRLMLRKPLGKLVRCGLLRSAQLDNGVVRVECSRGRKGAPQPVDGTQPSKKAKKNRRDKRNLRRLIQDERADGP